MCSIPDRTTTVLVVIDVQVGVVEDAYDRDRVVGNIANVVEKARAGMLPILWVQHSEDEMSIGSDAWQLVPELAIAPGEPLVHKQFRSSFEATDLEPLLAERNAAHLVIVGAQTNNCVRSTIYSALDRGYDVTLVEDAHTTSDQEWDNGPLLAQFVIDEQNRTLLQYQLPGRRSALATTAEVFST